MDMPNSVTVSSIIGNPPFEVYLCMSDGTSCYYIDYINFSQLPLTFNVPIPIQDMGSYCLKVVDFDGCSINNCFTIT